jgi:phage baseplate assembly protein W
MAINLYIRLLTTERDIENKEQHYKEHYRFQATGDDANASIQNYRLRHFLTANASNSTITANSGLMVYDGSQTTPLTGSYNDWTTPNRPPKLDEGNSQFNTELIVRFDVNRTFNEMLNYPNSQAWITAPFAGDNGLFTKLDIESAFSFIGYPTNNDYVKNPLNIALEHKVAWGAVSHIQTILETMPDTGTSDCDHNSNLYQVETVRVDTQDDHGLKVGDSVTLYSRSISHVPQYTGSQGRLFGLYDGDWKGRGERYLGDFIVTSVPNTKSFTYKTYHNPMKVNQNSYLHKNGYNNSDWPDLVWEKWELYEYTESVSASESGSSVVFTFTDIDPSGITCRHNFAKDDTVTFRYNGSSKVHMVVESVSNNSITAKPVDEETYPSGVTSGTLVYTPRMPSSDVAFNVEHSDIAPPKVKSHSSDSAIYYACQDTWYGYDQYERTDGCHTNDINGSSPEMHLVKDSMIPIIKFPIPFYNGAATTDPNMVARLFVYCNRAGGALTSGTIDVFDFTDNWDENLSNSAIKAIHPDPWTGDVVGSMSQFSVDSPTRTASNRYIKFDIKPEFVVNMFTNPSNTKTVFLNAPSGSVNLSDPMIMASREEEDGHWPYIAISSPTFIGKTPKIELDNTYMYLVCEGIKKTTYGGGPAFCATVSSKMFDPSNIMYVRSWNADKPFFAAGDKIEVMNTEHYDTVNAQVIGVEYDEHKVYFRYPDGAPEIATGVSECGIIRNKSRMISTYAATDAENKPNNLSVLPQEIVHGRYGYGGVSLDFDVIHDEATDNSTSLSVVYDDGVVQSNTETPVIITDLVVVEGQYDRHVDRYMHVGPENSVILKGFNLNKLSDNATAVLGHMQWEDGFVENGATEVTLSRIDDNPYARKFKYNTNFDLQRVMPVYGIKNEDGVTKFKLRGSDAKSLYKGYVLAPIFTGLGRDIPMDTLKYGVNYYVAKQPLPPDIDGYVWISLSSSYIALPWVVDESEEEPEYISLSNDDVGDIQYIIEHAPAGNWPLIMYSTVTSVTVKDNGLDTNLYANRLYLQIDEEAPVYYMEEQTHYAGVPLELYLSDLNDIYKISGDELKYFSLGTITYLLPDKAQNVKDARFIKITMNLLRDISLDVYDAAGNCTSIRLDDVTNPIFNLKLDKVVSSGNQHTLTFKVSDSESSLLSRNIASNAGDTGIFARFGTIPVEKISSISEDAEGMYYFTFDLVLTEDELSQSDGVLDVWAGDTNTGDIHKNASWQEPIVFKKEQTCVATGDVLTYRGVNLFDSDENGQLVIRMSTMAFSIVRPRPSTDSNTTISINVLASAQPGNPTTNNFGVQWRNYPVSAALSTYVNSVTVVSAPTIKFDPTEAQNMKWKKGEIWAEPSPWDVVAKDGTGTAMPASSIEISIDNTNWDESGIHTITYTATDECGRTASIERYVRVTECDIPIILTKDVYDVHEDIGIMIAPESTVLFNQNFMNNIVQYQLTEGGEWVTAVILSGTPDRKMLTIKNPGVITSNIKLKVYVGDDNRGANGCYWTDDVKFEIISREAQDKQLDVDGKASIVKPNSRSRFSDLNYEPIYNKDLSYSSFTITADENSLMQNVYSILLTNLGERLYDDEFGSTLEESVFEIIGDLNGESKLLNQCVKLINKYEPRAIVVEDKSFVSINEDNTVVIVLYIKVPRGVARKIELTFRKNT